MKDPRRTLLFLLKKDEILLAMKKRRFGAGLWNGVGGKLDPGETVEQALIRECQEEINVTPKKYHKVGLFDFKGGPDNDQWHMIVHAYICTNWLGEPTETEEMAPKWYRISDIPYKNMWEDDQHWLPEALKGKIQKGEFTFDVDDHLIDFSIQEVKNESQLQ